MKDISKKNAPLSEIKVLDFTIALAGVYIAWQFADLGATVYKVERYGSGDLTRSWDPFVNGLSTLYTAYNKNKESIELDLRAEEGKEVIKKLVSECDVVLENFKSGSIDRLGLGYDVLKEINPKIVFVSLSGFGGSGPLMPYPCYDAIAAARGGFAACNGEPHGAPMKAGNANCDTLTGTHAFNAALMGVIKARETGEGCHIDIGMSDTVMISCCETIMDYERNGEAVSRFGNHDRFIAPYGIFEARDGFISIIADSEDRWAALCEVLAAPELRSDKRFSSAADRISNRDELVSLIEEKTVRWKRGELEKALLEKDVPAAEVLPFIEAYTSDHSNETETTTLVDQKKIGQTRFYNNPLRFNEELTPIRMGAPLLGEHSRKILADAGYSPDEIDKLINDGVVGESLI